MIARSISRKRRSRLSRGGVSGPSNLRTSTLFASSLHSPSEVGSKFKSNPNFGNALRVRLNRTPYSFTPPLFENAGRCFVLLLDTEAPIVVETIISTDEKQAAVDEEGVVVQIPMRNG